MSTKSKNRSPDPTPTANDGKTYSQITDINCPLPVGLPVSGLYRGQGVPGFQGGYQGENPGAVEREEIRLDVDGHFPQMIASGVIRCHTKRKVRWIARLSASGPCRWVGSIFSPDQIGEPMPWRRVTLTVNNTGTDRERRLTAVFSARGIPSRTREYALGSRSFARLGVVIDSLKTGDVVTGLDISTPSHDPKTVDGGSVDLKRVLSRSGLEASVVLDQDKAITGPVGTTWSTPEIIDAYRSWSRHQEMCRTPHTWILNLDEHESGPDIGSIVMADIEGRKSGAVSIFRNSHISDVSAEENSIPEAAGRNVFFAMMHGLGDTMGLDHSWQKRGIGQGTLRGISRDNESEFRSFMNDPNRVSGGREQFYGDFAYRYSNTELLKLRHGKTDTGAGRDLEWFDHHGFTGVNSRNMENLELTFRLNRTKPIIQFMEPVTMELKLTNNGLTPLLLDHDILENQNRLSVIITRSRIGARHLKPVFHMHRRFQRMVLMPGESVFGSLMISAGKNGWLIDEPGTYNIEGVLHLAEGDLVANPLLIRVEPAASPAEEVLAQDFLTMEMASLISSGGSLLLSSANDVLLKITNRLRGRRVAWHAHRLLGLTMTRNYKLLLLDRIIPHGMTVAGVGGCFKAVEADMDSGLKHLMMAVDNPEQKAIDSFGHLGFVELVNRTSELLMSVGRKTQALGLQSSLMETLIARKVNCSVVNNVKNTINRYQGSPGLKTKKATG
jgi:hypothetical protein